MKESGVVMQSGAVMGGRLFQDVGPEYVKARCPAEQRVALGTLYRTVSEEEA